MLNQAYGFDRSVTCVSHQWPRGDGGPFVSRCMGPLSVHVRHWQ